MPPTDEVLKEYNNPNLNVYEHEDGGDSDDLEDSTNTSNRTQLIEPKVGVGTSSSQFTLRRPCPFLTSFIYDSVVQYENSFQLFVTKTHAARFD